jgi:hypothetical protein
VTVLFIFGTVGFSAISDTFLVADDPLQEVGPLLTEVDKTTKTADEAIASPTQLKAEFDAASSTKAEDKTIDAWGALTKKIKNTAEGILRKLGDSTTALSSEDKKVKDLIKKMEI